MMQTMIESYMPWFINFPVIALTLLTLFLPFGFVWRFWAFIYLILAMDYVNVPRDRNLFESLYIGFALIYGTYFGIIIFLRVCLEFVRYNMQNKADIAPAILRPEEAILDMGLFSLAGVIISGHFIIFIAKRISLLPFGFSIHLLLLFIFLLLFFIILRLYRSTRLWRLQVFMSVFLSIQVITAGLGALYPWVVTSSAHSLAETNAFCIYLPRRKMTVTALEDLTLYTMDKGYGLHHAILVIESDNEIKKYHWSFRRSRFVEGGVNYPGRRLCKTKVNFDKGLGLFTEQ